MMRFGTRRRSARLAALALMVLPSLAAAGGANPLRAPAGSLPAGQLRAGSEYMGRVYAERHEAGDPRESIPIDLADDTQYRFVMDRLQAAGKSALNAPYLFRRLEDARRRALARPRGEDVAPAATAGAWECDQFLLLWDDVPDATGQVPYKTGPTVTCTGGADYVYADVVAWSVDPSRTGLAMELPSSADGGTLPLPDAGTGNDFDAGAPPQEAEVLGSAASEEYEGGRDFHVPLAPRMPLRADRRLMVESMTIAMNDVTGQESITYLKAVTTPGPQPVRTSYDPAHRTSGAFLQDPVIGLPSHPRYAPGSPADTVITSCQIRGGSDCDYAVVGDDGTTLYPYPSVATGVAMRQTESPWTGDRGNYFKFTDSGVTFAWDHVYVPTQFSFDTGAAPNDCLIREVHNISVVRLMKMEGGTCLSATTTSIAADIAASRGKRVAPVKRLLDFTAGTTGTCDLNRIQNNVVAFVPTVSVLADCNDGKGLKERRFTGRSSDKWKWSLQILNSCLAEGTGVLRADGTRAPVESLRVGDKLLANARGLALTVTDVAHGGEMRPLVHLRDSRGHAVKVTEGHPMVLASGKVVKAGAVKVKDRVRTREGVASIVSAERVPSAGRVYNVTLGTPEERARVAPNERTLYANGFLVGDNAMQGALATPRPRQGDVLASLPRAWHHDFQRRPRAGR